MSGYEIDSRKWVRGLCGGCEDDSKTTHVRKKKKAL